jgi:hypothetical protein
MNRYQKAYEQYLQTLTECNHISANGTFLYHGEGLGAVRKCVVCGYEEECFRPDPIKYPAYVQWRMIQNNAFKNTRKIEVSGLL